MKKTWFILIYVTLVCILMFVLGLCAAGCQYNYDITTEAVDVNVSDITIEAIKSTPLKEKL